MKLVDIKGKADLIQQMQQVNTLSFGGVDYLAEFISSGGFGIAFKVVMPKTTTMPKRTMLLKIYYRAHEQIGIIITREARIHPELSTRLGSRQFVSSSDREMFEILEIAGDRLVLSRVPYSLEYIGDEMRAILQDFAEGELMSDYTPASLDDCGAVFSDYADSTDNARANGAADADRNPFNVVVLPPGNSRGSRIVHLDFGTTSLLNFNSYVAFHLLRFDQYSASPKLRLYFVLKMLHTLSQVAGDDVSELGEVNTNNLNKAAKNIYSTLTGEKHLPLRSLTLKEIEKQFSDEQITQTLLEFQRLLTEDGVLNQNNQVKLNILLNGVSFASEISAYFSSYNPDINWMQVIAGKELELVDCFPATTFGHYMAPCPATFLEKVHPADIEKLAVCSTYQMIWTMFTKLGLGDMMPINFEHLKDRHHGNRHVAFAFYEMEGSIPMIRYADFVNAVNANPNSILQGLSPFKLNAIFNFFMDFFVDFHECEVFARGSDKRANYRSARGLMQQFWQIINSQELEEA